MPGTPPPTTASPAPSPVKPERPAWGPVQQEAMDAAYGGLRKLHSFDPQTWKRIGLGALPGALGAAGLTWGVDRLLSGRPKDDEEQRRQRRRRLLLSGLAALGGGYMGGSAAWKYNVNPALMQGLGLSLGNPEKAFVQGMHKRWKPTLQRTATTMGERSDGSVMQRIGRMAAGARDAMLEPLGLLGLPGQIGGWLFPPTQAAWMASLLGGKGQLQEVAEMRASGAHLPEAPSENFLGNWYNTKEFMRLVEILKQQGPSPRLNKQIAARLPRLPAEMKKQLKLPATS